MNPTIALAFEIFGALIVGFGVGHVIGYWQGCRYGTRLGLKALSEYHEHTMKAIGDL